MRLVPLEDEQPINDRFIYKPSIDTTYLTSKAADEGSNLYDAAKFIGNDMLNTFNSAVDAYKTGIKEIPEYIKAYGRGSARLGSSLGTMVEYLGNQYTMIDEAGLKLQGYSQDDIKNASSIGKYISSFGKVINEFYDDAQEIDILKPSDKFNEPLLDNFTIGKVINKSIESLPFMGAGIATNMVTKSPLIATYAMSALDASELYEKAKEAGKDEATSSIIFQAGVLGTFAFEQFSVFGMLGKETKDTFLNTFLKGSGREASTESLQTLWQNIVEKIGVDKTKSLVENVIESGIVGGLTGGGLAAATAKYNNNIKEIEQELKDKGTPQEEIEFVYSAVGDGLKSSGSILNDALEGNFNKNVNIMTNFNYVTQLFQEGGDVSKTIIDNSNIDMAKDTVEDIIVKANDTITNNKEIVLENLIKKGYTQEQANDAILSIENLIAKPKQVIEAESKIKDILLEAKVEPKEADSISKIYGSASVYFSNKYGITPQEWVETLGLKVIKSDSTSESNIYKQEARGNIEFTDTGYIINLFNQANKSTLAHESWHLFSEELRRAAEVSPKAKSDYEALSKWSGLDKAKTPEEVRESLEKMARGGEEYLMLGKSPNARLQQVFENFKGWLTEIYQSIKNLGAGLNKDVINVFDDILGRDYTTKDFATKAEYTKNLDNQLKKKDIIKKTLKGIGNFTENLGDIAADSFVPIEDRIKAISPDLFAKVRRLNYSMLQRKKEYFKIAEPFIEKFSKLSDKDHYTLDLALKNSDIETVEEIIKRNGMMQDYLAVIDLMADLRQQMIEVGADIGQIPNYFPRAIKDVIEFLEHIEAKKTKSKQDAEEFSQIERVLKEKDPNNSLTNEEKAMVINSMFRGYGGQIAISRPSNVKGRKIITVDADMNQFYKSSSDALIDYITNATEFIENKKFFGGINIETKDLVKKIKNKRERVIEYKDRAAPDVKGRELRRLNYEIGGLEAQIRNAKEADKIKELDERKTKLEEIYSKYADMHAAHVKNSVLKRLNNELTELQSELDKEGLKNVEQSIGESVRILVENGTIKQKDEAKLKKLFLAKFQEKSMNPAFKLLRDTSYIAKLGHFDSAVTQLGDLALSSYKNGLWTTGNEFIKSVRGKSEITKQDLGIDNIIQEFAETGALSKTLDKVLKFTGFSKFDSFGKETLVNGAISNARKKARLNDPKLIKDLELYYGEQSQKVLSDLANNKLTPEVMEYGFFTLLDIQPITKDQMPLYYAEGGNKRLFYMLKSYTLKTINLARNDIILKFSDSPKEAIRNLIFLASYLMLFNAGVDFLKDLLLGREIKSIPDYLVDNMLFGGIFNRYTLRKTKQEGVGGALWDMMSPPILIDEITVDLLKKNKEIKDYRSWQNLPLIGRFYYNYWGGGADKESKKLY